MESTTDINEVSLAALRVRVTKVFPGQIRSCLEELNDEQIWWRPNEQSNSVGNLALHVRGAMMHFLCRGVGGFDYARDRPAEFATRSMPKQELLEVFDDAVAKADQVRFAPADCFCLLPPNFPKGAPVLPYIFDTFSRARVISSSV